MNPVLSRSLDERLADLGGISAARVCSDPAPGTASVEDLVRLSGNGGRIFEWIDRTLVEKAMGWQESLLAGVLSYWLHRYLESTNLGVVTGPDGLTRLFEDTVRGPDVAFINWERLPEGRIPDAAIPDLVPNFVIEVISTGNTRGEMSRKRREYFHAGVQLAWFVDPRGRTVAVFTSADDFAVYDEESTIDCGDILPGWTVDLKALFAKLDQRKP